MTIQGTNLFTSGQVLTAAQVNQYLMRGVKVFASAAVRDAAYGGAGEPTLYEGEVCYLTDTNVVQYYTGAAWVNLLDTTTGVAQTIADAKGDLIAATGADTLSRLAVGANGSFLKANSTTATGLEWATFAALGRVETLQATGSTAYTDLATVGPSVTLTTGTQVIVLHGMQGYDDGNLGNRAIQSVAVSGATTTAAADTWMVESNDGVNYDQFSTGYLFTVTAGSNTFTCKYRKSGGTSTASFSRRWIMAIAL